MVKSSKRIGALLMALIMMFSMFPTSVFAEDAPAAEETPAVVESAAPAVTEPAPAQEPSAPAQTETTSTPAADPAPAATEAPAVTEAPVSDPAGPRRSSPRSCRAEGEESETPRFARSDSVGGSKPHSLSFQAEETLRFAQGDKRGI